MLAAGEDRTGLGELLVDTPARVLAGELTLMAHADLEPEAAATLRRGTHAQLLDALSRGTLRHYALRVPSAAGERVLKVTETRGIGARLGGLINRSAARREHAIQWRAYQLEIAAVPTLGYLEIYERLQLTRSCQVQPLLPSGARPLGEFLRAELAAHGTAALAALGEALARTHAVPFFHPDLKPFHGIVDEVRKRPDGPATFRLRFIDVDRSSFHMSRRKRIINLYQALRYLVPDEASAQATFVAAYCRAAGWYDHDPARALALVRRFLAKKRRSHPNP